MHLEPLVSLLTLLLQASALAYALVLPGVLIGLAAGRSWSWPMRLGAGFTLGVLVVPLASFCAAWALGTNIQPPLVLGVATAVNLAAAAAWWIQLRYLAPSAS
jgi:hypothetical protein